MTALEIITRELGQTASPDEHLVDDLNADDLDKMVIAMALEDELGVTLTDEQVKAWEFVRDILEDVL